MTEQSTTRVFFAIILDNHIKQLICNQMDQLKKICSLSVRWVKESQLHLTLRFLGNLNDAELDSISQGLGSLEENPSFYLEFKNILAFPTNKPRVIGVGLNLTQPLVILVKDIEEKLVKLGYERENRIFLPHITLGRIVKPRRKYLEFNGIELPPKQLVNAVHLYKSQLTPDGSIYSLIRKFPLK